MPPGRPPKLNTNKYLVSLTDETVKAVDRGKKLLDIDRSQLIEDVVAKFLARHLKAELAKRANRKPK